MLSLVNSLTMDKSVQRRLKKMDADLTLLLKDLEPYSEAKLNEQPKAEAWSVFQVMNHLILVERSSINYVNKKLSFNPELKKTGVISGLRRVLMKVATRTPLNIKAPSAVGSEQLPDYSTFWEVAKRWKDTRMLLREMLEGMPADMYSKEVYKHPMAGRLSLRAMVEFLDQHFQRHRKQIYRTIKKVDAVKQL